MTRNPTTAAAIAPAITARSRWREPTTASGHDGGDQQRAAERHDLPDDRQRERQVGQHDRFGDLGRLKRPPRGRRCIRTGSRTRDAVRSRGRTGAHSPWWRGRPPGRRAARRSRSVQSDASARARAESAISTRCCAAAHAGRPSAWDQLLSLARARRRRVPAPAGRPRGRRPHERGLPRGVPQHRDVCRDRGELPVVGFRDRAPAAAGRAPPADSQARSAEPFADAAAREPRGGDTEDDALLRPRHRAGPDHLSAGSPRTKPTSCSCASSAISPSTRWPRSWARRRARSSSSNGGRSTRSAASSHGRAYPYDASRR